ncbi:MT-A70 family methyltransferase [Rhizobium mongolense]|uniref:N6-adenosine-specific RNA methylase IME4 n=1 Tax=Rhizobium mongolense TaxID=57676 RepID=A0A7W6RQZ3_9HYPH|nr:MT-A70 family methyltransferase [Rhizobium mongolense]MBB4277045.1 N6-adenosine-specific RNA methylase IME4 [Rhizobium mongolense]
MNQHLTKGERSRAILDTALQSGSFRSSGSNERQVCASLNGKGLLSRDKKDADLWYPSDRAKKQAVKLYGETVLPASEPGVQAVQAQRVPIRRRITSIESTYRLRGVDMDRVENLKASIRDMGLRTPITVQGDALDERVTLSAGAHRLEAMRQLGEEWIDCFHDDGDDLERELWEIDENLCRAELTAADRALFVFRRKEIYLLKHPETAKGVAGGRARQNSATDKLSFAEQTAEATGRDRRTIERDAARGEKITDMALHRLRGTRLDSGAFLDRLKQIPEDKQVLYVEAALDEEKRKAADVKENRRKLAEVRHSVRLTHMAHVQNNGAATAGQVNKRFPIIYADPPWQFGVRSEVTGREKSAENHYPTMPTGAICDLFAEIGSPAKADAVLFLWATNPMLPDALRVMEAWGFTYVHHWIWDKEAVGTGYWGRDRHELLLIGKKGNPVAPLPGTQFPTVHRERKGGHSAKPWHFAERIEALYPGIPKLEMFCRTPRDGWEAWGYEAAKAENAPALPSVSKAELAEFKALAAVDGGCMGGGPLLDELVELGLVWPSNPPDLTIGGANRLRELQALIDLASDGDAVRCRESEAAAS